MMKSYDEKMGTHGPKEAQINNYICLVFGKGVWETHGKFILIIKKMILLRITFLTNFTTLFKTKDCLVL